MRRRVGVEENGWCSVDGIFLGEDQGARWQLDNTSETARLNTTFDGTDLREGCLLRQVGDWGDS